jgi:YVTN family beta-propeller protein
MFQLHGDVLLSGRILSMKYFAPIVIVVLILSCGDSPTEPADPDYPTPSVLSALFIGGWFPPDTSKGTSDDVQLAWTTCPDSSFWKYTIYRSYTPDIESLPDSAEIIHITFNASDTAYTDTNTEWDTWFYYAVKTSNQDTLVSWSNEVSLYIPSRTSFGGPDWLVELLDVGAGPGGITSIPSGGYVYVACYFDNSVYVLETSVPDVITSVSVSGGPIDVCAGSDYVYVSCSSGNEVSAIRTSDNSIESTMSVGSGPISAAVVPNGSLAYVSCYLDDRVYIVDLTSSITVSYLPVDIRPNGVCILPSGEYLYVANSSSGTVSVFGYSSL